MAVLVMIYGQSGTGKSTSLRNFTNDEVAVINVSGKPLPFRSKLTTYDTDNYAKISSALGKIERKSIVIDDATYLMVNEFMRTAKVAGYQKYTDMAVNFNSLVAQASQLANDKIVYFLGHSDLKEDGTEHFTTNGRMLDNYVKKKKKFTIVLKTVVQDGKYYFSTHNSGQDTVKSPLGMFEDNYVDNDLKAVDEIIREYYGIGG